MSRFEGWYYKHQANGRSLALIPGRVGEGAFIQVITDEGSYNVPYPLSDYQKGNSLRIGENEFTQAGITLNIKTPELALAGEIRYANLTPIRGDIMGPFRFFPMECRHGVTSMRHDLSGSVIMNGETISFEGGTGYIESDSGRSFPEGYAWTQCNDLERGTSIMISIARIPFCGLRFWGCICIVRLDGHEYRLATYNGAKILRCAQGVMELRRGRHRLTATIDTREGYALDAPRLGSMNRIVRENLSCPARFRFLEGDRILFDGTSKFASYEYAMK